MLGFPFARPRPVFSSRNYVAMGVIVARGRSHFFAGASVGRTTIVSGTRIETTDENSANATRLAPDGRTADSGRVDSFCHRG